MGVFCLVLHTHLPYLRRNGTWPVGEEFYYQAAVDSYLPVLGALGALGAQGMREVCTVGVTPVVAHQMADPYMHRNLETFLGITEMRAMQQVANYRGVFETEFKSLAGDFAMHARAQAARLDSLNGNVASGFAALARDGVIELLGGPATHPYLPRVRETELARTQLRIGAHEHARHFGARPAGMWLPECAYDPEAHVETLLHEAGVGHTVIDGPTMLRSAGPGSTFAPRRIGTSDVVAFARNLDVTYRVWSPTGGYPAGKWYRDFYHYDVEAGFKNWRVTSIKKPLHEKRPYEPARALQAARADAEDFAALIAATLQTHERETGREAVVVAAYDTELFGHWWYEGPEFLRHLFETLATVPGVRARTLAAAREELPEPEPVDLVAGSWGFRKDDRSWVSEETEEMWWFLGEIEAETVRMMEKYGDDEARAPALAQLVREAMLAQSSDWPFMILRGRNPEYARERFANHRARWNHLATLLRRTLPAHAYAREAAQLFDIDNVVPDLEPRAAR
jgi:1,4-alpha-glucan branching enzyme